MKQYFVFGLVGLLVVGCVSVKEYDSAKQRIAQMQHDSVLLEKRIGLLKDEVVYLRNQSATMEQSLVNRLQEKQDSLAQKQAQLTEQDLRLQRLNQQRLAQQDAFLQLSQSIIQQFVGYAATDLVATTGCANTSVWVNDKLLFAPQTTKWQPTAEQFTKQVIAVLQKHADVQAVLVYQADSAYLGKEKGVDAWSVGFAKATIITNQILKSGVAPSRVVCGIKPFQSGLKLPFASGLSIQFYSTLIPCVHQTD
ncbi:MAG: hypothetical protein MUE96_06920 [Bacteroidia bacterium]|jgi:hypothetical protein|nr:hypothetical protein [Bacteroidia bacterium]